MSIGVVGCFDFKFDHSIRWEKVRDRWNEEGIDELFEIGNGEVFIDGGWRIIVYGDDKSSKISSCNKNYVNDGWMKSNRWRWVEE